MYIHPFIAGVALTLVVGMVAIIVIALHMSSKK